MQLFQSRLWLMGAWPAVAGVGCCNWRALPARSPLRRLLSASWSCKQQMCRACAACQFAGWLLSFQLPRHGLHEQLVGTLPLRGLPPPHHVARLCVCGAPCRTASMSRRWGLPWSRGAWTSWSGPSPPAQVRLSALCRRAAGSLLGSGCQAQSASVSWGGPSPPDPGVLLAVCLGAAVRHGEACLDSGRRAAPSCNR